MKRIVFVMIFLIAGVLTTPLPCLFAAATISGTLNASSPTWDRLKDSGSVVGTNCNGTASDSYNDGVPYAQFVIRTTTNENLIVQANAGNTDIDTLLLVYCYPFDPANPTNNLIAIDDDGAGHPHPAFTATDNISLLANTDYVLVVTAYSTYPFQGPHGNFEISLSGNWAISSTDFGDAPDPAYATLRASSGACHVLGSSVFLGATVDAELDGQPTADANGDDTNGTTDDEDGVVFTSSIIPDTSVNVDITASISCTLSAWIDFNGDGDWTDAGEELFPGGTVLNAGVNNLTFPVPADAVEGNTYARFRATTDGPVSFSGEASDGEVEDYLVTITTNSTPPIPTLNEWGMIVLALILMGLGYITIRKQKDQRTFS